MMIADGSRAEALRARLRGTESQQAAPPHARKESFLGGRTRSVGQRGVQPSKKLGGFFPFTQQRTERPSPPPAGRACKRN